MFQFAEHRGVFLVPQLLDQGQLVPDDGWNVKMRHCECEPWDAVVRKGVEHLCRSQQRLRRDASDIDARPADRQPGMNQRGVRAELVRLDGGTKATSTSTDDDQIVMRHGSSAWIARITSSPVSES